MKPTPITLEERISKYVAACPAAISRQGGHVQTFSVACALVNGFALDQQTALEWLRVYNARSEPPWSEPELRHKVRSALCANHTKPRGYLLPRRSGVGSSSSNGVKPPVPPPLTSNPAPTWPSPDLDLIDKIVTAGPGLVDLREASPTRFEHETTESRAPQIMEVLFPGNPLLCCGWSNSRFATRSRLGWENLFCELAFFVPNPMAARSGKTQEGRESAHSLSATGPRVYLSVEFDFSLTDKRGEPTIWAPLIESWNASGITLLDASAALHLRLADRLPLACATFSGGKSLHGLYAVAVTPKLAQRSFFADAMCLGGDVATWGKSQFVRVPDGLRDGNTRQTCFFLNPNAATL